MVLADVGVLLVRVILPELVLLFPGTSVNIVIVVTVIMVIMVYMTTGVPSPPGGRGLVDGREFLVEAVRKLLGCRGIVVRVGRLGSGVL